MNQDATPPGSRGQPNSKDGTGQTNDSRKHESKFDVRRLAGLMGTVVSSETSWNMNDLGAMLAHQLQTRLDADLPLVSRRNQTVITTLLGDVVPASCTFGRLFTQNRPPLEALRTVKDLAKSQRNNPDSPMPVEIATVLYFASIAKALVSHNERVTSLSNADLRKGFEWIRSRDWVDVTLRNLSQSALDQLGSESPS